VEDDGSFSHRYVLALSHIQAHCLQPLRDFH
jgi:hypothetical protein